MDGGYGFSLEYPFYIMVNWFMEVFSAEQTRKL